MIPTVILESEFHEKLLRKTKRKKYNFKAAGLVGACGDVSVGLTQPRLKRGQT